MPGIPSQFFQVIDTAFRKARLPVNLQNYATFSAQFASRRLKIGQTLRIEIQT